MISKKRYVKIKKNSNGRYIYEESNDDSLSTLSFFLRNDYGCDREYSLKKWINNFTMEVYGGNSTSLEKEGDKIIITLDLLDDEEVYKKAFETTIEELSSILDQWNKLCKKMPKQIIITRYKDKVFLEGKD